MRYWGILVAKLAGAGALLYAVWLGLQELYVPPEEITRFTRHPFTHDLGWTTIMFFYNLLCNGVLFLVILDQKYRCRSCGRRLRMPVCSGSHAHILFKPPKTEYICVYGHGTLKVPDIHFTGKERPAWKENGDMWEELFSEKDAK